MQKYHYVGFYFQLASTSFPLCMRRLHTHLRKEHHLRHFGRMQYGLFLKGIGMTLEDALKFWKIEFTKKIDSDQVGFLGLMTLLYDERIDNKTIVEFRKSIKY